MVMVVDKEDVGERTRNSVDVVTRRTGGSAWNTLSRGVFLLSSNFKMEINEPH